MNIKKINDLKIYLKKLFLYITKPLRKNINKYGLNIDANIIVMI